MPTVVDELIVRLGLNSSKFDEKSKESLGQLRNFEKEGRKHAGGVQDSFSKLGGELSAVQNRLLGIAALFLGGMGISQFTEKVARLTNELSRMGQQSGMTARDLSAWGRAGAELGGDPASVRGAVSAFSNALYDSKQSPNGQLMTRLGAMNIRQRMDSNGHFDVNGMLLDMSKWATAPGRNEADASSTLRGVPGMNQDMITLLLKGPDYLSRRLQDAAKFAPSAEQVEAVNKLVSAWEHMQTVAEKLGNVLLEKISPILMKIINGAEKIMMESVPGSPEYIARQKQTKRDAEKYGGGGDLGVGGALYNWWNGTGTGSGSATPQKQSSVWGGSANAATNPQQGDLRPGDGNISVPWSGGGGVGGLAADRMRFRKELEEKPWLREKIMGIAAGENKNSDANLSVLESMMNRASQRGTSLEQAALLHGSAGARVSSGDGGKGGYYAGYDAAALNRPNIRKMIDANVERALGGSNVSDLATDNASSWLADKHKRTGGFTFQKEYGKESFFSPGTAGGGRAGRAAYEKWREQVMAGGANWDQGQPAPYLDVTPSALTASTMNNNVSHRTSSETSINNLNVNTMADDPYGLALGIKSALQNTGSVVQANTGPN